MVLVEAASRSTEVALPVSFEVLAASADVVSRGGGPRERMLVRIVTELASCLLKCINMRKAGEAASRMMLRRRLRVLAEVSTRTNQRRPRRGENVRLWDVQHGLHECFLALASVAHHRVPRCVILPVPGARSTLRLLPPISQLLAPLDNLIQLAIFVNLLRQK